MTSRKTISVWLVMENGENAGKVLLQKRSANEKNFPNIHQATWAGKADIIDNKLEDTLDTIKRECLEELGEDFYKNFDFNNLSALACSGCIDGETSWECSNYFGKINEELLSLAQLHEDAHPNFVFIGMKDEFYPIKSGNNPEKDIVLFNDQYKILKELLNNHGN